MTCPTTNWNIGTLQAGQSWTTQVTCQAITGGCPQTNSVVATGEYSGQPIFTGSDSVDFDIGTCTNAPEFPSLALPVELIVGLLGAVLIIRRDMD